MDTRDLLMETVASAVSETIVSSPQRLVVLTVSLSGHLLGQCNFLWPGSLLKMVELNVYLASLTKTVRLSNKCQMDCERGGIGNE